LKKYRLTIITTSAFDSESEAEFFYDLIKGLLESTPELKVSGNVTKILGSCCGKEVAER